MSARRILRCACLLAALVAGGGCERVIHDMHDQPRFNPYRPTPLFPDGSSARPQVPGTIVHAEGVLAGTSSGRAGAADEARRAGLERAQALPGPITIERLERGRERFEIYCAPCHSPVGDGDGFVVRRGFPRPPSYHTERLRAAPDRHFYDVITAGYGAMYPYADRVAPADRWAIVAYIRALQLSQYATLKDVPEAEAIRLQGEVR